MDHEASLPWYRYFWGWFIVFLPLSMVIMSLSLVVYMLLHPIQEVPVDHSPNTLQHFLKTHDE